MLSKKTICFSQVHYWCYNYWITVKIFFKAFIILHKQYTNYTLIIQALWPVLRTFVLGFKFWKNGDIIGKSLAYGHSPTSLIISSLIFQLLAILLFN